MIDPASIENFFRPSADHKCAFSEKGMVAAAHPLASRAGADILARGGNAADAACAAALTLCVCEPQACSLGGQTMVLLHLNGRGLALDGSGRVPALARVEEFGEGDRDLGWRATTVPTTPAVLGYMHKRFGRLNWPEVVKPAINAAQNGFPVSRLQHDLQKREQPKFLAVPDRSGAAYFLKNGIDPHEPGDLFCQEDLAKVLQDMAENGVESFYTGSTARLIDQDMRAHNGFLRAADLARIPWPLEKPVLTAAYRGLDVITTPPPTPGRNLLLALRALDRVRPEVLASGSAESLGLLARVLQGALLERRLNLIDPDRYDPALDPALINEGPVLDLLRVEAGSPEAGYLREARGGETTHLSVMDRRGDAVGLTQSVNMVFGAKAAARGLGFLYNNYLLDSNVSDPDHPHYLRPGGRPWSWVAPAMVLAQGRPWLVTGSPGSERIIPTIVQFLSHVLDGGRPICEAMIRPRIHLSVEGRLSLEAERFDPKTLERLAEYGYELDRREPYAFYLGAIHAVLKRRTGQGFQGVAEIRRDGTAQGPDQSGHATSGHP